MPSSVRVAALVALERLCDAPALLQLVYTPCPRPARVARLLVSGRYNFRPGLTPGSLLGTSHPAATLLTIALPPPFSAGEPLAPDGPVIAHTNIGEPRVHAPASRESRLDI